MKRLVLSLFALVCAIVSFAQNSLLATLSHEGNVTTFYGASALRDAHDVAVHGDVITLSSGSFNPVNITKAVTLRGAGMAVDSVHNILPTIISGDFTISIPDSVTQRFTLEGIYHNHTIKYINLNNAMFVKCRLNDIDSYSHSSGCKLKNATFTNCRFGYRLCLSSDCSASCINSIIQDPQGANLDFRNCVIYSNNSTCGASAVTNSMLSNCIIYGLGNNYNTSFPKSTTAYNCVEVNNFLNSPTFKNIPNNTNKYATCDAVFKTYKGARMGVSDNETFELTETAKATYLGTDGTEVGIYGGMLPFDTTPSNPRITKCNVAAKSTADGKLSVDIEVKAAE
ncbi:MAG: hypothetical protein ACI3X6_04280 [Alloprevotella sp.]